MKRSTITKRRGRWAIAAGLAAMLFGGGAQATIVKEQPWHPVAGAYRSSVFFLNLEPIDWGLIARSYDDAIGKAGSGDRIPFDILAQMTAFSGEDNVAALRAAIAAADRTAFYATATRATSQTLRFYLDRAAAKLAQPGAALNDVQHAGAVYRAFAGFIRQAGSGRSRPPRPCLARSGGQRRPPWRCRHRHQARRGGGLQIGPGADRELYDRQLRGRRIRAARLLRPGARTGACTRRPARGGTLAAAGQRHRRSEPAAAPGAQF